MIRSRAYHLRHRRIASADLLTAGGQLRSLRALRDWAGLKLLLTFATSLVPRTVGHFPTSHDGIKDIESSRNL